MNASDLRTITVIGAGTMGHGIAHVAAMMGATVHLYDALAGLAAAGKDKVAKNLAKGVELGKVDPAARDAALARILPFDELAPACAGTDCVIEAVPEQLVLKQEIFRDLEKLEAKGGAPAVDVLRRVSESADLVEADLMIEAIVEDRAAKEELFRAADAVFPEGAILASNTSSIPITSLAAVTARPERVIGMHFFNPVHMMKLVEVVQHPGADPEMVALAVALAERMGKTPITVTDSPGFASSRLGLVIGLEAMRMVEQGVASAADIDTAMKLGYGHPMGPLELTDLVGLDVRLGIAEYLAEAIGPGFTPPQTLRDKVAAGHLGKKTGQGYYRWSPDGKRLV